MNDVRECLWVPHARMFERGSFFDLVSNFLCPAGGAPLNYKEPLGWPTLCALFARGEPLGALDHTDRRVARAKWSRSSGGAPRSGV